MIGIGLGLGMTARVGGGANTPPAGPTLPAFAPIAETTAYTARFTTAPDYRRTYHVNKMVARLKAHGNGALWSKLLAFWPLAETDVGAHTVNLRNPGTYDLTKVGSPTHTPGVGVSTTAGTTGTSYYDTGLPLSALNRNAVTMGLETATASSSTSSDFGAVSGANGLTMAIATVSCAGRIMGGVATFSSNAYTNGLGMHAVSRGSATQVLGSRDGVNHPVANSSSTDLSAAAQTIHILKTNGSTTTTGRVLSAAYIANGELSEAEKAEVYGAWKTYHRAISEGLPTIHDAGTGAATVSADLVVYGATALGVCAAYEARRQGKTAVIVGGWRERHLGGMSANGLGWADFMNKDGLGGLPRAIVERMRVMDNRAGTTNLIFRPRMMDRALREMLDPDRGGYDIPVYWSDGVASATKTGARLSSFTTVDGRTFSGKYFHDATYEGDLMAEAGVSFATGREAAGSGWEAVNGYRGLSTAYESDHHQFLKGSTFHNVDPYLTPGDPESGLIYNVIPIPDKALGDADDETQSFNNRLTLTTTAWMKKPFPATPPAGYAASNYEALGRWLAAATAAGAGLGMEDIFNLDVTPGNTVDANADGGMASDFWGSGTRYVAAQSYAEREGVWKSVENWIKGLWYYLCYENDARITSGLRTAALGYGYASDHYLDPRPEDEMFYWSCPHFTGHSGGCGFSCDELAGRAHFQP